MSPKFMILFSVIIVLFLMNRYYVYAEAKRRKNLKPEKIPTDREIIEMLDDPITGEKAKVSESFGDSDDMDDGIYYEGNNRTSQKVLNKYNTEDGNLEQQFHLIKNYLLDQGFQFRQFNAAELSLLEQTKLLSGFAHWEYGNSYRKGNLKIFTVFISSKDTASKYSSTVETASLFFWIENSKFSGHYCFYRKSIVDSVVGLFQSDEVELKNGYQTVVFKKSGMEKELSQFLETLQFDGDLEIEVNDSDVFVRITNIASLENMIAFYDLIKGN